MSTQTKMTVMKSNDKAANKSVESTKGNKHVWGKLEGKTLQSPLNDREEYKNVDSDTVRIPVPEDNSVPTWRCANGAILPMLKAKNEEGEFEYRPRKKRGPAKGKRYAPRKGKIAKMMAEASANNGVLTENFAEEIDALNEKQAKQFPEMPGNVSTDVFGDLSSVMSEVDCVDFQALVHAWQMRSIGALNEAEFALIKKSIYEKRQTARAAMLAPTGGEQKNVTEIVNPEMTF